MAVLSGSGQSAAAERAGHVREVLTGYRSGTAEVARPGEPRPHYDPARPLGGRQEAKARAWREGPEALAHAIDLLRAES